MVQDDVAYSEFLNVATLTANSQVSVLGAVRVRMLASVDGCVCRGLAVLVTVCRFDACHVVDCTFIAGCVCWLLCAGSCCVFRCLCVSIAVPVVDCGD